MKRTRHLGCRWATNVRAGRRKRLFSMTNAGNRILEEIKRLKIQLYSDFLLVAPSLSSIQICLKNLFMHKMIITSIVSIMGFISQLFGQDNVTISGRVVDGNTHAPIAFAHIQLQNSALGTVSNLGGSFDLVINSALNRDTVIVSYIGYSDYKLSIATGTRDLLIKLFPSAIVLDEVVVEDKSPTANTILLAAIERLANNEIYPTADFKLEGFYRQVYETDGKTKAILEAAFNAYDKTCTNPIRDIEIIQVRKKTSDDYSNLVAAKVNSHNFLETLFGLSVNFNILARKGIKTKKVAWAVGHRPYEMTVSTYNNRPVYIITHKSELVKMEVVIDADNYAVLRNEYKFSSHPDDYDNYIWKQQVGNNIECGYYITHQIYEYRAFEGKYYPSFFYRAERSTCFDYDTKSKINDNWRYYQLLVNDIILNVPTPKLKGYKNRKDLTKIDFEYDQDFWNNYNSISDLPRREEVLKDLGSW